MRNFIHPILEQFYIIVEWRGFQATIRLFNENVNDNNNESN